MVHGIKNSTQALEKRITSSTLSNKVSEAIRDVTKLRGQVELVEVGSLPNDGKVIEDARSYQ